MVTRKLEWEAGLPNSESAIRSAIGSTVLPFWVFPGRHFVHSDRNWCWPNECSEWITENSHQSAPHWAPWRASYRHVSSRMIHCLLVVLAD